jgi:uncharacterized repeat protein (TIGR01451 family)
LPAGDHPVVASYAGDANFNGCVSPPATQTVRRADTASSVAVSANPATLNTPVTITATVAVSGTGAGSPTGTVQFRDGANVIGTGTLSGGVAAFTTSSLALGDHYLNVIYPGDANFNASSSTYLYMTVVQPSGQVDLAVTQTDAPDPVRAGTAVTYRITLTNNSSTGTSVRMTDTLPAVGSLGSYTGPSGWTCTTPSGQIVCTHASFPGNGQAVLSAVWNVPSTAAAGLILYNAVTAIGQDFDPNMANNTHTAQTTVYRSRGADGGDGPGEGGGVTDAGATGAAAWLAELGALRDGRRVVLPWLNRP